MSERRNLQSMLWAASECLGDALAHLNEASDYAERYDFLEDANPTLHDTLDIASRLIKEHRDTLWSFEVES